jgi:hypothetical protein
VRTAGRSSRPTLSRPAEGTGTGLALGVECATRRPTGSGAGGILIGWGRTTPPVASSRMRHGRERPAERSSRRCATTSATAAVGASNTRTWRESPLRAYSSNRVTVPVEFEARGPEPGGWATGTPSCCERESAARAQRSTIFLAGPVANDSGRRAVVPRGGEHDDPRSEARATGIDCGASCLRSGLRREGERLAP